MAKRHRPFKWCGYKAAIERYGLDEAELLSLQGSSKLLFQETDRT